MSLKIINKFIPLSRRVCLTFRNVYGIGKYRSKLLCKFIGIHPYLLINSLNISHVSFFNGFFISAYKNYEVLLKRRVQLYINKLVSINCYRGKRLFLGLPCRGQRTHSNHKTTRKLRRIV